MHTHTRAHTHTHTPVHTQTHTDRNARTHVRLNAHTHTNTHTSVPWPQAYMRIPTLYFDVAKSIFQSSRPKTGNKLENKDALFYFFRLIPPVD